MEDEYIDSIGKCMYIILMQTTFFIFTIVSKYVATTCLETNNVVQCIQHSKNFKMIIKNRFDQNMFKRKC